MSTPREPEDLILDDLDEATRERMAVGLGEEDRTAILRLGDALSQLDADGWESARVPALRFVPEGAGAPVPLWSRVCVRGDGGGHRLAAPAVAAGVALLVVISVVVGFVLRGLGDDPAPASARGAAMALVRTGSAPPAAGGLARMGAGQDAPVMLRLHGLEPAGSGRRYEVRMMRDARHGVRVGTLRVAADGTAVARFRVDADLRRYRSVEVSLSSAGGSASRSVLRSAPPT